MLLMGKLTVSMAIFNSELLVITRGYLLGFAEAKLDPRRYPMVSLLVSSQPMF